MATKKEINNAASSSDDWLKKKQKLHISMIQNSTKKLQKDILDSLNVLKMSPTGKLDGIKANLGALQKLQVKIEGLFYSDFNNHTRKIVRDFKTAQAQITTSYKMIGEAAKFTNVDKTMMDVLRDGYYKDYLGISETAKQKVVQSMYDNVIAGGQFSDLESQIRQSILGSAAKGVVGASLAQYAKLYARDMIMNYHNEVNMKKADDLGMDIFIYTGTIMGATRDFCRRRVGNPYTKKEINSWKYKWKGKSGPALTNRGGYNCRHHWQPVRKEWLDEKELSMLDKLTKLDKDGKPIKKKAKPVKPAKKAPVKPKTKPAPVKTPVVKPTPAEAAALAKKKEVITKATAAAERERIKSLGGISLSDGEDLLIVARKKAKEATSYKKSIERKLDKAILPVSRKELTAALDEAVKSETIRKASSTEAFGVWKGIKKGEIIKTTTFSKDLREIKIGADAVAKVAARKAVKAADAVKRTKLKAVKAEDDIDAQLTALNDAARKKRLAEEAAEIKPITVKLTSRQKKAINVSKISKLTKEDIPLLQQDALLHRDLKLSAADIKKLSINLKKSMKVHMNAPIGYTGKGSDMYKSLLKDGEFKNQFSLGPGGSSGGHYSPTKGSARDKWERNISGGTLQENPKYKKLKNGDYMNLGGIGNERPIYGYASDPTSYGGAKIGGQYGDVTFVLKDEVKGRSTLFRTNTSGFEPRISNHQMMSPDNNAEMVQNIIKNDQVTNAELKAMIKGTKPVTGFTTSGYTEAQMYGGLNIKRDVAEILVDSDLPHIKDLAQKYGVTYKIQ